MHDTAPIVTITPNPSLDILFETDHVVWDDANRVAAPRRRAGGQGVNLARAAAALGGACHAVAPFGGAIGDELQRMLRAECLPLDAVRGNGETRIFVSVHTADGRELLLNPRGPDFAPADEQRLFDAARHALDRLRPGWVACCGSVPPGVDERFYARVAESARAAGARFVADCDGALLRHAAPRCDLLVPNRHEAGRLLGRTIDGRDDAAGAALELRARGADVVAITLGARGAVLATADGVWYAAAPAIRGGSAVGAGDAFLAALLLALQRDAAAADALCSAVAAGAAVLRSRGSDLLVAGDYDELRARVERTTLRGG